MLTLVSIFQHKCLRLSTKNFARLLLYNCNKAKIGMQRFATQTLQVFKDAVDFKTFS